MNPTVIRIAHSRQRSGFTAFAFEFTPTERYGIQRSRVAIAAADTLQEAQDSVLRRARESWQNLGLPVPPISIVGRVSDVMGRAGHF